MAYDNVITKFNFFIKLTDISKIRMADERLCSIYKNGLDTIFIIECIYNINPLKIIYNIDPLKIIIAISILIKREEFNYIYPYASIILYHYIKITNIKFILQYFFLYSMF